MDEFKEEIAALNDEIAELHGLAAGLTAEIDTLRRACLAGLHAARDRAPVMIDSIVEMICADLAEHARAHASDDDDDWRDDLHNVTATELEAALQNIMRRHLLQLAPDAALRAGAPSFRRLWRCPGQHHVR